MRPSICPSQKRVDPSQLVLARIFDRDGIVIGTVEIPPTAYYWIIRHPDGPKTYDVRVNDQGWFLIETMNSVQ